MRNHTVPFFFFSPSIFSSTRKSFLHARNKRKRYTVCRIYVVEDMNEEIRGGKNRGRSGVSEEIIWGEWKNGRARGMKRNDS